MEKRVVCINNKLAESILTVNKVYEVKRENDVDTIVIVGDDNVRYVVPRAYFKEVTVIKKVRYIKESCAYIPNMRIGDVYEVVEETEDGFYIVINNKRMTTRVPKSCFEEIKKVVCVDNSTNRYITIGKEYEEVEDKELQEWLILIKNDIGKVEMYPRRLFKQKISINKDTTVNGNIAFGVTFDTSELQSKLEKALYHLKELDKIMGEIEKGDVKVKVDR